MSGRTLLARIDGVLLGEKESRDLWARFSTYMDEHQGDLGGFAKKEGLASIRPSIEENAPILLGSHSEAQTPYRNVSAEQALGGSGAGPNGGPGRSAQPKQNRTGGAWRSNAGSGKSQPGANNRSKKR